MSSNASLTITHPRILEFFRKNATLNPDIVFLSFVEMIENITQTTSIDNNLINKLIGNVQQMSDKIDNIQNNIINNIVTKQKEFENEYLERLKYIIINNNSECIEPILREMNSSLFDKFKIHVNETIPSNNNQLVEKVNSNLNTLQSQLASDIRQLHSTSLTTQSLNEFINTIDSRFNNSINNIVSQNNHHFTNLTNNVNEITSLTTNIASTTNSLHNRFASSNDRGRISEQIIATKLSILYPTAEVEQIGDATPHSCDIKFVRRGKPKILVENKDWTTNVARREVDKAINDMDEHIDCCCLFLSQHTGICNIENFEFRFHRNRVILFVAQCNYDEIIIKIAIELIDELMRHREQLEIQNNEDDDADNSNSSGNRQIIPMAVLEQIRAEYNNFKEQRNSLIALHRDYTSRFDAQIRNFEFPNLANYIESVFATSTTQNNDNRFICEICGFPGRNRQSLSAHMRGHRNDTNRSRTLHLDI